MLTGTTKNLGVMGWPIAHSLSPVLQNAAIAKAGLDYVYTSLPVRPEQLAAAVTGLKALQFRGWNVTIPHKSAIMPLLDAIDEDARIIGAVNTVVNDGGKLTGYNTDVIGFIQALLDRGFDPAGKEVVLLGAGGAARAVVWGLIKAGTKVIHIGVRSPRRYSHWSTNFRRMVRWMCAIGKGNPSSSCWGQPICSSIRPHWA
jgi:shikimate dehydrogenase